MKSFTVLADEELLNRYNRLSKRLRSAGSIIQNDMQLEGEEIVRATKDLAELRNEISELWNDTLKHISKCTTDASYVLSKSSERSEKSFILDEELDSGWQTNSSDDLPY